MAFAVYTLDYDEERSPYKGYSLTQARMESVGSELVESVDFLSKEKIGLVLLGSSESGKAIVPREFPRLSNFGDLGGPHEVAIASACHYFWTDGVGALWLSFPFRRPVLFSNQHSLRVPKWGWSMNHVVVPVIFKDRSGRELTFREELSSRPPFSKRGDLIWIRNSPLEIAEAHKEMLARLEGSWKEDEEVIELRHRFESMFRDFPEFYPAQVSAYFLKHHSNLLD